MSMENSIIDVSHVTKLVAKFSNHSLVVIGFSKLILLFPKLCAQNKWVILKGQRYKLFWIMHMMKTISESVPLHILLYWEPFALVCIS